MKTVGYNTFQLSHILLYSRKRNNLHESGVTKLANALWGTW